MVVSIRRDHPDATKEIRKKRKKKVKGTFLIINTPVTLDKSGKAEFSGH